MTKRSAGLMMYRRREGALEVFLVHPGGPFWVSRDLGAWTIPKGTINPEEPPIEAAQREFQEETSFLPQAPYIDLGAIKQIGGKIVAAWAFEGDCNPAELVSNLCHVQWPPRTGERIAIPEIDRGAWFTIPEARTHIIVTQTPFLDRLEEHLRMAA